MRTTTHQIIQAFKDEAADCRKSATLGNGAADQHFWLMAITLDSLAKKLQHIANTEPTPEK